MPKIPINECPAGPAMDAAVAELLGYKVDWELWPARPSYLADPYPYEYDGWAEHEDWRPVLPYSTDIAAAWELWRKLAKRFFWVEVSTIENLKSRAAVYHDIDPKFTNPVEAFGETAPLAICRAFLKANGVEYIEVPE